MKKINKGFCFVMVILCLTSCSPVEAKPYYAPTDQVMKWFDHGTFGESRFYNYCPSTFILANQDFIITALLPLLRMVSAMFIIAPIAMKEILQIT